MTSPYKVLFLVSTLYLYICHALDPSVLQVELVFPRNNTVYKPTKDFPIVFAIHNFSKGWKYRPSVLWDISSWDTTRDKPINIASDGTIGVNPFLDPKRNYGPSPPDTYLAINSSNKLTQEILHLDPPVVAGPMYFLNFRLDLDQGWECAGPVNRSKYSWEAKHPWVEAGRIIFSLNSTTGVDAKVIADNSCAQPVGTIGILGENQTGCPNLRIRTLLKNIVLSRLMIQLRRRFLSGFPCQKSARIQARECCTIDVNHQTKSSLPEVGKQEFLPIH